jgi:hypothetical protein
MSGNINIKSLFSKTARFIVLEATALLISFMIDWLTGLGYLLLGLGSAYEMENSFRGITRNAIASIFIFLLHLHIFAKHFITYYIYREAEAGDCLERMGRRAEASAARFKYMFAAYAAAYSMASVICAPFGGGFLSALAGAFLGKSAKGVIAAVIVSLLALACRAGNFSDAAYPKRVKIFAVVMIINYACISEMAAFFFFFQRVFAWMLGMVIFSSVLYLKSHELEALEKIKSLGRDEWLRSTKKPVSFYIIIIAACVLGSFLMSSLSRVISGTPVPPLILILVVLTLYVLHDENKNISPRSDKNLS